MNKIDELLASFLNELKENERSLRTIKKYSADICQFLTSKNITTLESITKDILIAYKCDLVDSCKPSSVNNKIIIINKFLTFAGLENLKLKLLKLQKKTSLENVLSVSDYERLLKYAEKLNKTKTLYTMKVLANTGIRIDELKFITVEAFKQGYARVSNKGKIRDIIISKKLSKELKKYCTQAGIKTGVIFITSNNKPIDNSCIWRDLKYIAGQARVNKKRVHAHSFRHLFAKEFMSKVNNVVLLADILGHSSLETTRIYTKSSIKEQRDILEGII